MRLFGQEVQVPCASVPAAAAAAAAPAGQHKPSAQSGTVEALQFVRYFHLVPALGVRAAYEAAAKRAGQPQQQAQRAQRFEELLLAAEAGAHHAPAGSAAARVPLARLLSSPQILALGLVWESPQVGAESLGRWLVCVLQLARRLGVAALLPRHPYSMNMLHGGACTLARGPRQPLWLAAASHALPCITHQPTHAPRRAAGARWRHLCNHARTLHRARCGQAVCGAQPGLFV